MTFHEKRIVVLGGSSGIGLAVAQAAAREGAEVIIASSRQERLDAALKTLPPSAKGHAVDLSDETAVKALFARLGSFDHLVFTAGESLQLEPLASCDVGKRSVKASA
jgi:NAD(P)-dependent dehydrogenase (short-subunit alcohol dehydrogenase family)